MSFGSRRQLWSVFATGSALLAALAVRHLLESVWEEARGEPPPRNPAHPDTAWSEALAWTATAGAVAGISRMLARRGAAAAWARRMDELPPQPH